MNGWTNQKCKGKIQNAWKISSILFKILKLIKSETILVSKFVNELDRHVRKLASSSIHKTKLCILNVSRHVPFFNFLLEV